MIEASCTPTNGLKGHSEDKEELAIAKKTLQLIMDAETGKRHYSFR
jgi:hypothetical protein